MRLAIVLLTILILASSGAKAQSDEALVHSIVMELFRAMAAHDGATLYQLILPEASVVAVMADGTVRKLGADEFIRRSVSSREEIEERIWDAQVSVHGDVASLVAPYDFLRQGKRTHCGVDAITLVKNSGTWRISNLFFTVHTSGCPASPLDVPGTKVKPQRQR